MARNTKSEQDKTLEILLTMMRTPELLAEYTEAARAECRTPGDNYRRLDRYERQIRNELMVNDAAHFAQLLGRAQGQAQGSEVRRAVAAECTI